MMAHRLPSKVLVCARRHMRDMAWGMSRCAKPGSCLAGCVLEVSTLDPHSWLAQATLHRMYTTDAQHAQGRVPHTLNPKP